MDWSKALCRKPGAPDMYPVGVQGRGSRTTDDLQEEAAKYCVTCPIKDACLLYALENNEEYGVWGGQSESQRRRTRKRWLKLRRAA